MWYIGNQEDGSNPDLILTYVPFQSQKMKKKQKWRWNIGELFVFFHGSPFLPSGEAGTWAGVPVPAIARQPVHPLWTLLSYVWKEGASCTSVIHGSLTSGRYKSMWESTAFTDKINHPSISVSLSWTCYVTVGRWPNSIQIQLTHLTNGENNGESLTVVQRRSLMCSKL